MNSLKRCLDAVVRPVFGGNGARYLGYLGLCAAYLEGGIFKVFDFNAALAEMSHFGVSPAGPFAIAVIVLELLAPAMILTGKMRWLGSLALAAFTLMATFVALRFWDMPAGEQRFMATNSFFEHLGLVGGFLLIAWLDLSPNSKGHRGHADVGPTRSRIG